MNNNFKKETKRSIINLVCSNHRCNNSIIIKNLINTIDIEYIDDSIDLSSIFFVKQLFYIKCPKCQKIMFDCDPELTNIIIEFNKKNYITEYCCASGNHYHASKLPYILFHYNEIKYNYSDKILKEFKRILSEIDKENIISIRRSIYKGRYYKVKITITDDYKKYLYTENIEDINKEKAEELRLKWLSLVEELANKVNVLELNEGE